MAMQRTEAGFLALLGTFLTVLCLLGLFHYDYSATLMRFPLLAAGVTLAVVLVRLIVLRRGQDHAPGDDTDEAEVDHLAQAMQPNQRRRSLIGIAVIASILPLVFFLGFPLGVAVFLLWALRCNGESWALALIVSVVSLLLTYGLFLRVLWVPLPVYPVWWPTVWG